jgi:hypothetical protein
MYGIGIHTYICKKLKKCHGNDRGNVYSKYLDGNKTHNHNFLNLIVFWTICLLLFKNNRNNYYEVDLYDSKICFMFKCYGFEQFKGHLRHEAKRKSRPRMLQLWVTNVKRFCSISPTQNGPVFGHFQRLQVSVSVRCWLGRLKHLLRFGLGRKIMAAIIRIESEY